jgi:hypothetical protein
MFGNVKEWVADWYVDSYYQTLPSLATDPEGPSSGVHRVLRGGCWDDGPGDVRVSSRDFSIPSNRGVGPAMARTSFAFWFATAKCPLFLPSVVPLHSPICAPIFAFWPLCEAGISWVPVGTNVGDALSVWVTPRRDSFKVSTS